MDLRDDLLRIFRRLRTWMALRRANNLLKCGKGVHIGANVRLWAPSHLEIGRNVYIGKDCHIETNLVVGDNCLIANRVAFIGRHDHDIHEIGVPVRVATWVGHRKLDDPLRRSEVRVDKDVWIGFGAILLSGVSIGRGAVIGAGAIVTRDVAPYAIVAGNPARVIGERFDVEERTLHEQRMESRSDSAFDA